MPDDALRSGRSDAEQVFLRLDGARCDGHGICALRLPHHISLDEWGYAVVDRLPIETYEDLRRARRAVRACPVGALSLVGDDRVARRRGALVVR